MTIEPSGPLSQAERLERLEREYRNLTPRLDRLEKQRGSCLAGLAGNVLVLVSIVLLLDYLGFLPAWFQHLPVAARSVDAEVFVLRDTDGKRWGQINVSRHRAILTRYGADGRPAKEEPLLPGP